MTDGAAAHAGGALTVSVAARVFVEPWALVNVASYLVPLCAVVVAGVVYDPDVAPLIGVNEPAPGAARHRGNRIVAREFDGDLEREFELGLVWRG